ncbi:MAG: TIGR02556 family CRISPR-associated protein [Methanospirillum sp.]
MIHAIHALGKDATPSGENGASAVLATLCEDPASSDAYKHLITIDLRYDGAVFSFLRVGIEELSKARISRYLYRRGSSRGADLSLTARLTEPGKTLSIKILGWCAQDFADPALQLTAEERAFVDGVCTCLRENADEIREQVVERSGPLQKQKESVVLTVTIEDRDGRHYIGDFDVFRRILVAKALAGYYQKYNTESRAEEKVCSICRRTAPEVYGFVSTYAFYTVDKPGMVSGGFNQADAWRNYPVCRECALALEEGKKYLDRHSCFSFYGFDYYLIPQPIRGTDSAEVREILEFFQKEGRDQRITGQYSRLLDDTREEILDLIARQENTFTCTILVFRRANSEFKILLAIEDVFPSRLRQLFDAKRAVDRLPHLRACQVPVNRFEKNSPKKDLEFTFENIWAFFGKEQDSDKSPYFLELVNRIFAGQPVSYSFLLWAIARRLRKQFVQRYPTREHALRALSLIFYLERLGVLQIPNGENMQSAEISMTQGTRAASSSTIAEELFNEYTPFFASDARRAIFLVGALTQLLLDVQYTERKATPFRTKLQGLRLDQRRVQGLLPEVQNKFEEYRKNYYRDLERLAADYLVRAGADWRLSKDEISFLFVVGMNHAHLFKNKEHENKEIETNGDPRQ